MKNVKRLLVVVMAVALLDALIIPALAAGQQTIYLKGSGNNFNETWNNVFYLGGAENDNDPNVWHIVYTGNNFNAITCMHLYFTNGEEFNWDPSMGPSTNGGGNNPGWVVVAPADWALDYVNKGNNNESDCYVITDESGNIQFNISGYHKGTPNEQPKFGSLCVSKEIAGVLDQDSIGENQTFKFIVTGPEGYSQEFALPDTQGNWEWSANNLKLGEYTVTENTDSAQISPYILTVTANGEATSQVTVNLTNTALEASVNFVNTYDITIPDTGSLSIYKDVAGALDKETIGTDQTFTFTVTGPNEYEQVFTLPDAQGNWNWSATGLELGEYTVTEDTAAAQISSYNLTVTANGEAASQVTVTLGERIEASVEFVNTYSTTTPEYGSLTLNKDVTGGYFNKDNVGNTFDFTVTGPSFPDGESVSFSATDGWTWTRDNLIPGEYTITENLESARINGYILNVSANGIASSSYTYTVVVDAPEGSDVVTFVNNYTYNTPGSNPGSLTVTKAFNITNVPNDWSATITVTGPGGYSQSANINGANLTATFNGLESGSYTVTEVNPGDIPNYTFVNVQGEGNYDVTSGATTQVTLTNYYSEITPPPPSDEPMEEAVLSEMIIPLAEFPPVQIIEDAPAPLAEMPQTGIHDSLTIWIFSLCATLAAAGVLGIIVIKESRKNKTSK